MKTILVKSKPFGDKEVLVDDEDFERLSKYNWFANKGKTTFYFFRWLPKLNGKRVASAMHRELMGVTDGKLFVDHKDHNGLNNQKSNLRIATQSQSNANRRSIKNSSSKYLGVFWHKRTKRWRAMIAKDSNRIYIGSFKIEEEAARAYDYKAKELHREFANLNFPMLLDSDKHIFS